VGAEFAAWIVEGSPRREGLKAYNLDRFRAGELVFGDNEPGMRTPH
jgi:hypothetical protein